MVTIIMIMIQTTLNQSSAKLHAFFLEILITADCEATKIVFC